jgi:TetR/AcrR family transcriptional repressor of nem operon
MPRTKKFDPEKTLVKAMNLFWENGYHSTSMQDLVDHLEINRASLYDTYGGKEQLFSQALEKYQEREAKAATDILYYYTNVPQGLRVLFQHMVDNSLLEDNSRGCFHINTINEFSDSNPELARLLDGHKSLYLKMYGTYLNYGIYHRQFTQQIDINILAETLYVFQAGLMTHAKLQKSREHLLASVDNVLLLLA